MSATKTAIMWQQLSIMGGMRHSKQQEIIEEQQATINDLLKRVEALEE